MFKITIEEIGTEDEGGCLITQKLYEQSVQVLDLPNLIMAINKKKRDRTKGKKIAAKSEPML